MVMKDAIEEIIGEELKAGSVVLQWGLRWAAMLYNRFKVGADGKHYKKSKQEERAIWMHCDLQKR